MRDSQFWGIIVGICGTTPGFAFPETFAHFGATIWPVIQGGTGLAANLLNTYHNVIATLPADESSKVCPNSYRKRGHGPWVLAEVDHS
jgi:hypothetical protein